MVRTACLRQPLPLPMSDVHLCKEEAAGPKPGVGRVNFAERSFIPDPSHGVIRVTTFPAKVGGMPSFMGVGTAHHCSSRGPAMYEDVYRVADSSAPYACQLHNYRTIALLFTGLDNEATCAMRRSVVPTSWTSA